MFSVFWDTMGETAAGDGTGVQAWCVRVRVGGWALQMASQRGPVVGRIRSLQLTSSRL